MRKVRQPGLPVVLFQALPKFIDLSRIRGGDSRVLTVRQNDISAFERRYRHVLGSDNSCDGQA